MTKVLTGLFITYVTSDLAFKIFKYKDK